MTEAEKIMIDALVKIHQLAQSWEGRKEAPYWNLGDIAASALIKAAQQGVQPTLLESPRSGSHSCACPLCKGSHTTLPQSD